MECQRISSLKALGTRRADRLSVKTTNGKETLEALGGLD